MKKIVFDLDDTLWNLNKRACELTGIDYNKITTFKATENRNLTIDEKNKLLNMYQNPSLWDHITYCKGAEYIHKLEKLGVKVYINTNCMTKSVADFKRKFLSRDLHLPNDQIIIKVEESTNHKILDSDVFIFVDDSSFNIEKSTAKYTIIPNKPWNQTVVNNNSDLLRFNSLIDIINCIEILVTGKNNCLLDYM